MLYNGGSKSAGQPRHQTPHSQARRCEDARFAVPARLVVFGVLYHVDGACPAHGAARAIADHRRAGIAHGAADRDARAFAHRYARPHRYTRAYHAAAAHDFASADANDHAAADAAAEPAAGKPDRRAVRDCVTANRPDRGG